MANGECTGCRTSRTLSGMGFATKEVGEKKGGKGGGAGGVGGMQNSR